MLCTLALPDSPGRPCPQELRRHSQVLSEQPRGVKAFLDDVSEALGPLVLGSVLLPPDSGHRGRVARQRPEACACTAVQERKGGPSPGFSGKQPSRWRHGWALLRAQTRKCAAARSPLLALRHGWVAEDTFGTIASPH